MAFTIHPSDKNLHKQWLGRAPGCPVPASEVKVLSAATDELIRIEKPTFFSEKKKHYAKR